MVTNSHQIRGWPTYTGKGEGEGRKGKEREEKGDQLIQEKGEGGKRERKEEGRRKLINHLYSQKSGYLLKEKEKKKKGKINKPRATNFRTPCINLQ